MKSSRPETERRAPVCGRREVPISLIADIHMPKKSGLLLIEELEAHSTSTRIIAMTDGGPATRLDLLGLATLLGAVQTIAKPFPLEKMLSLVQHELDKADR
jgi:DNA-binding NtrC family response regulator